MLKSIEKNFDNIKWADYVFCQCYLGIRPSEFLALDASNYNRIKKACGGRAKTDAGKDRVVETSPKIQQIIDRLIKNKIAGSVFCEDGGKPINIKDYRTMFSNTLNYLYKEKVPKTSKIAE